MVFTITSLLIRFVAGKASDRYGRIHVIKLGLILLVISLCIIGYADTFAGLMSGAAVYGISTGILSPALNAWTVDMSHPEHRGKAMATMYISLEAGIGLGALFSGWYYQDVIKRIPMVMYISAGLTFVAVLYMYFRYKKPVEPQTHVTV